MPKCLFHCLTPVSFGSLSYVTFLLCQKLRTASSGNGNTRADHSFELILYKFKTPSSLLYNFVLFIKIAHYLNNRITTIVSKNGLLSLQKWFSHWLDSMHLEKLYTHYFSSGPQSDNGHDRWDGIHWKQNSLFHH